MLFVHGIHYYHVCYNYVYNIYILDTHIHIHIYTSKYREFKNQRLSKHGTTSRLRSTNPLKFTIGITILLQRYERWRQLKRLAEVIEGADRAPLSWKRGRRQVAGCLSASLLLPASLSVPATCLSFEALPERAARAPRTWHLGNSPASCLSFESWRTKGAHTPRAASALSSLSPRSATRWNALLPLLPLKSNLQLALLHYHRVNCLQRTLRCRDLNAKFTTGITALKPTTGIAT
jgi:hypothetical protein